MLDKPYKGPQSYESQDADLFFGRDRAAEQVVAKVLSSRFTVLHAQSGAGKTSLLNASVMPQLESHLWLPVRARPHMDPSESVRLGVFRQLLPGPDDEASAIERAREGLARSRTPCTLGELVTLYDELPVRDERRRRLISPLESSSLASVTGAAVTVTPFFCRVLRGSVDLERLQWHLQAIGGETEVSLEVQPDTSVDDMSRKLRSQPIRHAYSTLVSRLRVPAPGLRAFFENWWDVFGSQHPCYSIVLILDQFEELFTRFADPGAGRSSRSERVLHWSIRDEFFEQLRESYESGETGRVQGNGGTPAGNGHDHEGMPLRFMIALRDEYLARLDPIRQFVWDLDESSFHLRPLLKDEAEEAIRKPARYFGYDYAEKCFTDIVRKLASEDRFVEPAHVQIVCDRLWSAQGQRLAQGSAAQADATSDAPAIAFETYDNLGRAEGILRNFINVFLESLDAPTRLEALEILEPLITAGGTRNIVEWRRLVTAPFRDAHLRTELLAHLEASRIVRTEWRLGALFVEITHEFLIEPILKAIHEVLYGDSDSARVLAARRELERVTRSNFREDARVLLTTKEIQLLHDDQDHVQWTEVGIEAMLRSVIVNYSGDKPARAKLFVHWCRRHDSPLTASRETPATAPASADRDAGDRPEVPQSKLTLEHAVPVCEETAVEVIRGYATSHSPAVRRNVVEALAALADGEAIEALVRLAVEGPGEIRQAAADTVIELSQPAADLARDMLVDQLTDPQRNRSAYALLGRWYSDGFNVALPRRPLRERIGLATSMGEERKIRWRNRFRLSLIGPGLLGALVGGALACFWLLLLLDESQAVRDEALPLIFLGILIASPVLVLAATQRAHGIQFHPDQPAAAAVHVWRATVGVLFPIPIALLFGFLLAGSMGGGWYFLLAGALVVAIASGAVRAGTLAAYEAITARARANRIVQWGLGGASGVVMLILLGWILTPLAPESVIVPANSLTEFLLLLVPAQFGIAGAFSMLDEARPPKRAILRRLGPPLTWSVLALVYLGLLGWGLAARVRSTPAQDPALNGLPLTSHLSRLPAQVQFRVQTLTSGGSQDSVTIGASVSDGSAYPPFALRLLDSSGREIDYSYPPEFEMELAAGVYTVRVTSIHSLGGKVLQRLFPRSGSNSVTLGVFALSPQALQARALATQAAQTARNSQNRGASASDSVRQALALLRQADSLAPGDTVAISALALNSACWWGALAGYAELVFEFCERAVTTQPNNVDIIDSRGLAAAFLGKSQIAIRDFERFASEDRDSPEADRALRRTWITWLETGSFSRTRVLESLRMTSLLSQ